MVNLGAFINELDVNLLTAFAVFIGVGAPVFGYFYNRLMDSIKVDEGEEHSSLYVVIGVAVTLFFAALISWKSALLLSVVFIFTGLPMIIGEFKRTKRRRKESAPRRKRLPYAANGILDEAKMAITEAQTLIGRALKSDNALEQTRLIAAADHEIGVIAARIMEVKQIQSN